MADSGTGAPNSNPATGEFSQAMGHIKSLPTDVQPNISVHSVIIHFAYVSFLSKEYNHF